jgi:4-hydroxy-2-oxoheptanedioate aldolase
MLRSALHNRSSFRPATWVGLTLVMTVVVSVIGGVFVSTQGSPVRLNGAIDKLSRGESIAGAIVYDFSLFGARQFATSELDFVILDMEHQAMDFERLQTFMLGMTDRAAIAEQGSLAVSVPALVRIPTYGRDLDESIVKQVLDLGAFGIMFPAIETGEQAIQAVRSARYPPARGATDPEPRGLRGNGNMPAAWAWGLSRPEYTRRADAWPADPEGELLLMLQIETMEGVRNLDEILSVPGIGTLFVGPNDLSYSLGVQGGAPDHEAAIQTILEGCQRHNVPCAITVNAGNVAQRLQQGFRVVSLPSGGLQVQMDDALRVAQEEMQR